MLLQWTLYLGIFCTIKGTRAENLTTTDSSSPENYTTVNNSTQKLVNVSVSTVALPRSRPDWILLVTPGCALVLGFLLFSLLVSLQRRTELRKRAALNRRRRLNEALKFGHRQQHNTSSNHNRNTMNSTSPVLSKASLDNLSYENVDVTIYSNDFPEPNDYLTADDDYMVPDGGQEEPEVTLGGAESYENMVTTVYAQPRRSSAPRRTPEEQQGGQSCQNMESSLYSEPWRCNSADRPEGGALSEEDEDYVVPAEEEQEEIDKEEGVHLSVSLCLPETDPDTDGESYENMDNSTHTVPNGLPRGRAPEEEEDSYEKMESHEMQPQTHRAV
ncbi:uncharacterized protein [Lepisosteus oculatus]|uniref:uncharacterized protein isoform X2 n=1 Tax=Lepisosteus oculatus TaxID=7918 RepID=UPI003724B6B6